MTVYSKDHMLRDVFNSLRSDFLYLISINYATGKTSVSHNNDRKAYKLVLATIKEHVLMPYVCNKVSLQSFGYSVAGPYFNEKPLHI